MFAASHYRRQYRVKQQSYTTKLFPLKWHFKISASDFIALNSWYQHLGFISILFVHLSKMCPKKLIISFLYIIGNAVLLDSRRSLRRQLMHACIEVASLMSAPRDPEDCVAHQAPLSCGTLQASIGVGCCALLEGSSQQRDQSSSGINLHWQEVLYH